MLPPIAQFIATFALCRASLISATTPPSQNGYTLTWSDPFTGDPNSLPSCSTWTLITGKLSYTSESETYTSSPSNVHLSSTQTLQIVPLRNSSVETGWTSARIEGKSTFTPKPGSKTRAEASIRFGDNAQSTKKGYWPAFWMLSNGTGTENGPSSPYCGEIDVLEVTNGEMTGYASVHCDVAEGGICNEPTGLSGSVDYPDLSWHTWGVEFDRRADDWKGEAMNFYIDDQNYFQVTGSQIGDETVWTCLAHSPLFFILNIALGGDAGKPDSSTQDGNGARMEVAYVAVYES
ncbi:putative endo-1,3(4)-beta-glucanase [Pseudomassariella vexata]|uniref:Putative endo-1,3(4)-beta-glucanase n=1 Tax=Pseudomassariella vexata TaxID=1141098 RepID=A0A1Y2DNM9_9PEZI|nr:putative endo-1,3(4)-beta-glucanase [Pseudomassariella vexata]ORY60903.1 putative endo-1,3(4)-beta-glucanase [Pseudomassariella vexata]